MRRTVSLVLCAVMVLLTFAGCSKEDKNHEHTFAEEYEYDSVNHWLPAACEHKEEMANFGQHVDENEDGVCDICGYEDESHEHTFAEEWSFDKENHWHAATCKHRGAVADKAPHADENNDGACDVCGTMGDHEHTYDENWSSDEKDHWHKPTCGHDIDPVDKGEHVDEDNDGNCDVCGWFDKNHTHTYEDKWTTDSIYHWYAATCEHTGSTSEKGLHEDTNEDGHCDTCDYLICSHKDDNMDGVCDICGWYDVEHKHTFDKMESDGSGHWQVATCHPGATSKKEGHVDANRDGKCDVCEYELCAHGYDPAWSGNDTHHWHVPTCKCDIPNKDYGKHVDANHDGVCDVCKRGQKAKKLYTDITTGTLEIKVEKVFVYSTSTNNIKVHLEPGTYVAVCDNDLVELSVVGTDEYGGSAITFTIQKAGDYEIQGQVMAFDNTEFGTINTACKIRKLHDLTLKEAQGKVEVPSKVTLEFAYVAPKAGKFELVNTNLDIALNDEIGMTGLILTATKAGEKLTFTVGLQEAPKDTFEFEWLIREKKVDVVLKEGANDVKIPISKDVEMEFVAPADGCYLFQAKHTDSWFGFWNGEYGFVETLAENHYLTQYLKAGEKINIYIQQPYGSVDVNEVVTVTNVGATLGSNGTYQADIGKTEKMFSFPVYMTSYYKMTNAGGTAAEFGIIRPDGTIEWVNEKEVKLQEGQTYIFYMRSKDGSQGQTSVSIKKVTYEFTLARGSVPVKGMRPGIEYAVIMPQDIGYEYDLTISWNNRNVIVYVDGEAITSGTTIKYRNQTITAKLQSNGAEDATFTLEYKPRPELPGGDGSQGVDVEGVSGGPLTIGEEMKIAVTDIGRDYKVSFTAQKAGSYKLSSSTANAYISTTTDSGSNTVIDGAGDYIFQLNAGEKIEFLVSTNDWEPGTVAIIVTHAG